MGEASNARAMYTPSHGQGKLIHWAPGQSGNPSGKPLGMKEVRQACRKLGIPGVEALSRILTETVIDEQGNVHNAHEGKVVVAALQIALQWGFGKPPDYDPREDNASITINTAHLSKEDRALLLAVLRKGVLVPADSGDTGEPTREIDGQVVLDPGA